jgi:tetratricopeptide (TPR) repeat protein
MEHLTGRTAFFLLLLMSISSLIIAQTTSAEVRVDPIVEAQELAAVEEPLDLDTFIRAAFVFSGVSGEELPRAEAEIRVHLAALRQEPAGIADPRERAEAALAFMHETILKRYDERQTRLDVLLSRGSYNCVSSGVLYAIFLKALGLKVWGVRTADHAFCRVQAGDKAFDVETTSPYGFDPGTRKEFTDSFGQVTGYSYVPPSNYRDRRDIGEGGLLGLILFNRSAFTSERRDYAQAVPPAVDAYALLQDAESHERMITALLNLASWYGMNGRFEEALTFLDRAVARYGNNHLDALRGDLIHNWALSFVQKGEFVEAEELLDLQLEGGRMAEQEWRELTVYLYQLRAQSSAREDFSEAARLIQEGINKVGSDQSLTKSYEVYIHNSVVTLVRAERYQDALSVLEEALSQVPTSRVLQNDKSMVLKTAGQQ